MQDCFVKCVFVPCRDKVFCECAPLNKRAPSTPPLFFPNIQPTLLSVSNFIRLHIMSQTHQYVCARTCVGVCLLTFCCINLEQAFYFSTTLPPASRLRVRLFEYIMLMRVLLHPHLPGAKKGCVSSQLCTKMQQIIIMQNSVLPQIPISSPMC